MKTIGLIGGMSWESSLEYYRIINEELQKRLGGMHSAKSLMYSVDFAEIEEMQRAGNWEMAAHVLSEAAQRLEAGGAELVVMCTNTMHKVAESMQRAVSIPLLHIADATGSRVADAGITRVGLLGTRFTMEETFYKERLEKQYGLTVLIPPEPGREIVHRIIYDELVKGIIRDASRARYSEIISELVLRGAEGVILGCTEIGLLVSQEDASVPLFDTTRIHAEAAAEFALEEDANGT